MINIFKDYFQKSKVFLYPLLKIPKGSKYVPKETYIYCDSEEYLNDKYKLFCLYKSDGLPSYENFENIRLLKNELFIDYKYLGDNYNLYVFDLSIYYKTWLAVSKGLYSKINGNEKKKIEKFFGNKGLIAQTIESYLYPNYYYIDYAEALDVSQELIEKIGELCDPPNKEKETFKINSFKQDIKNNSISLPNNKLK